MQQSRSSLVFLFAGLVACGSACTATPPPDADPGDGAGGSPAAHTGGKSGGNPGGKGGDQGSARGGAGGTGAGGSSTGSGGTADGAGGTGGATEVDAAPPDDVAPARDTGADV